MEKKSINAAAKVRKTFIEAQTPLTLFDISLKTNLKSPSISMALCYLLRQKYLTRTKVWNPHNKGRKQVWSYEYHPNRIEVIDDANK